MSLFSDEVTCRRGLSRCSRMAQSLLARMAKVIAQWWFSITLMSLYRCARGVWVWMWKLLVCPAGRQRALGMPTVSLCKQALEPNKHYRGLGLDMEAKDGPCRQQDVLGHAMLGLKKHLLKPENQPETSESGCGSLCRAQPGR